MSTAISPTTNALLLEPPVDLALSHKLLAAQSRLVDGCIPGGLGADTRRAFLARQDQLRQWLIPAETDSIEVIIAGLMTSFFAARSVSPMEAQVTVRKYAMDLAGIPLWAIKKACSLVAQGKVQGASKDFPPAAPRLRTAADEVMEPTIMEVFRLKAVIVARDEREPSPEERKCVGDGLKALGKLLTATSHSEREGAANVALNSFQRLSNDQLRAIYPSKREHDAA